MKRLENETKDFSEEYTLSVGKFARLCGTTRDTLRHYYESGVIVPWIDPENGYHYYSLSQVSSFFFVSTMRQAGCTIKEIGDLVNNSSKEGIKDLTNAKILDMQKEMVVLNKKISALKMGLWILETFDRHSKETPFIMHIPDITITRTPIQNKAEAHHTADIASELSKHLARSSANGVLSTFPSGVTISYEDLVNGSYVYNSVVSLSILPSDGSPDTVTLPSCKALCCHHESRSHGIDRTYKKIIEYIKENGLKACSDLYIISMINLYRNDEHTFFKYLFICVEK